MNVIIRTVKGIIILLGLFVIVKCSPGQQNERPRETWVFRSVIDERPRMLTAALHENLWVSYDLTAGHLYKGWKGGVNFDGAVYTTAHGPQPTSKGYAYITDDSPDSRWRVLVNDNEVASKVEYKGHRIWNGHLELLYELTSDAFDSPIEISESPEYVDNGDPGLERIFTLKNVPDGVTVDLYQRLSSLPSVDEYKTNSTFEVIETKEESYDDVSLYTLEGWLKLGSNAETNLTTYFYLPDNAGEISEGIVKEAALPGAELIDQGDCKTCHNETKRTVGPSYLEIAGKYGKGDNIKKELAIKVINGGTGVWGEVPMSAHPDLTEDNAILMVDYILSLDEEEEAIGDVSMLGQPSVTINLSDDNKHESLDENATFPGLALNVFIINTNLLGSFYDEGKDITFDLIKETCGDPVLAGAAPAAHLVSSDDFGPYKEWVFQEYNGEISVQESRTYSFRLISDDGSRLLINGREIIDNGGMHGNEAKDAEVTLNEGANDIQVQYYQGGGGGAISLQWANPQTGQYEVVSQEVLTHKKSDFQKVVAYVSPSKLVRSIPGDQEILTGVHPAFDIYQARPEGFEPKVGGIDFDKDGNLLVSTWDSVGPVYRVEGIKGESAEEMQVTKIAMGLAEPLGLKVVEDTLYVLQKQELTKLVDLDDDGIIDEYLVVSNDWKVSSNFHEFAFGLVYEDGFFYMTLATAILPGGASADPQIPDRGKVVKINRYTGETTFVASGLRTPNGIGIGVDGEMFVADNQGDWLPSSKIVHVKEGAWYGSRSVDFEGTAGLEEMKPVVWLPQDEIGNSPSTPLYLDKGPYAGQMMHGEVTHGGLKRVFVEKINGAYQGAVFRFTQGLEAGVNRIAWGEDGDLYVGGIGNPGNWSTAGQLKYGLQRLHYNGNVPFEMLEVKAKTDGIELVFTQPIEQGRGISANEYQIEQWYYLPTVNYGGPKLDLETLKIKSVNVSPDRKRVFLELEGVQPDHMVYVRLKDPFLSSQGASLWTTEAWYTMNQIPEGVYGEKQPQQYVANNVLSDEEEAEGWKLLFDGKTTSGWSNYNKETIGKQWWVEDGNLTVGRSDKWNIDDGGDIVTDDAFKNFELKLEWKIATGGNNGVIYNVIESEDYGFAWITGQEFQLLDNLTHANRFIDTHRAGDLFGIKAGDFVTVNPAGQWNRIRIIKNNDHVEHWMNGYKVLEYQLNSAEWDELLSGTRFAEMSAFGKAQEGKIALQDQGYRTWFRNIKIKNLDPVQ